MKSVQQRICLLFLVAFLLLPGCSAVEKIRPLAAGEPRLTSVQMPQYVREELTYDVILTFHSEETPQIRKVCFRWVAEELSTRSPELYNYSMSNDFHASGSQGNWLNQGVATGSDYFCVDSTGIRSDVPGQMIVRIKPSNLNINYNKLEGYAEYVSEGRVGRTNTVGTRVTVEK